MHMTWDTKSSMDRKADLAQRENRVIRVYNWIARTAKTKKHWKKGKVGQKRKYA